MDSKPAWREHVNLSSGLATLVGRVATAIAPRWPWIGLVTVAALIFVFGLGLLIRPFADFVPENRCVAEPRAGRAEADRHSRFFREQFEEFWNHSGAVALAGYLAARPAGWGVAP